MDSLDLRAGPRALHRLAERGLHADDVDLLIAASGGPKWLALVGLDSWLLGEFLPARSPGRALPLLGSSIGSWRIACMAAQQPLRARDRLLAAYLAQRYPENPRPDEVSAESRRMLAALLDGEDRHAMIDHPGVQLHVLVTGMRGLAASGRRTLQLAGLAGLALGNLLSPRLAGMACERLVYHGRGDTPWTAGWRDQPTRHFALTAHALDQILLASGSIPLLFDPAQDPNWPHGALYDGGILDYHPLPRAEHAGLVLYPHFHERIVPGWFDKTLRWRHSPRAELSRTLMIAPSRRWLERLPGGRIPDRKDFTRMDDAARVRIWRQVIGESQRLGEELATRVAHNRLLEIVRPF